MVMERKRHSMTQIRSCSCRFIASMIKRSIQGVKTALQDSSVKARVEASTSMSHGILGVWLTKMIDRTIRYLNSGVMSTNSPVRNFCTLSQGSSILI